MTLADCIIAFVGVLVLGIVWDTKLEGRPTRWALELAMDAVNGFKAARRQRLMVNAVRAEEARLNRIKARVVAVGGIEIVRSGSRILGVRLFEGWEFYADDPIPEYRLGLDGVQRYMGYTPAELAEIHARRDEFTV